MKFKKLESGKTSEVEKKYSEYWEKNKVFEKSVKQRKENFVFYDGPATANGMPGIHHMMAKLLKDTMENVIKLEVPLIIDIEEGDSWYSAK